MTNPNLACTAGVTTDQDMKAVAKILSDSLGIFEQSISKSGLRTDHVDRAFIVKTLSLIGKLESGSGGTTASEIIKYVRESENLANLLSARYTRMDHMIAVAPKGSVLTH